MFSVRRPGIEPTTTDSFENPHQSGFDKVSCKTNIVKKNYHDDRGIDLTKQP